MIGHFLSSVATKQQLHKIISINIPGGKLLCCLPVTKGLPFPLEWTPLCPRSAGHWHRVHPPALLQHRSRPSPCRAPAAGCKRCPDSWLYRWYRKAEQYTVSREYLVDKFCRWWIDETKVCTQKNPEGQRKTEESNDEYICLLETWK